MAKATHEAEKEQATEKLNEQRKKCFIISPFGPDGSEIRRKAEGLIDAVIKPVLDSLDFDAISSLDISKPGSISNQVIEHLLKDDLVIANLTGLNPNVMYELAVRHSKRLPVVSLVERTTILPFDINQERTFSFDNDMKGVIAIQPILREAVLAAMEDKEIDNPIYRVVQQLIIQQEVQAGSPNEYIIQKLNEIEARMGARSTSASSDTSSEMNDYMIEFVVGNDILIEMELFLWNMNFVFRYELFRTGSKRESTKIKISGVNAREANAIYNEIRTNFPSVGLISKRN